MGRPPERPRQLTLHGKRMWTNHREMRGARRETWRKRGKKCEGVRDREKNGEEERREEDAKERSESERGEKNERDRGKERTLETGEEWKDEQNLLLFTNLITSIQYICNSACIFDTLCFLLCPSLYILSLCLHNVLNALAML